MPGYITEQLKREHQRPGCCIACDTPLPIKPAGAKSKPRTLLCGERECARVFNAMVKSANRELAAIGMRSELERAAALVRKAERSLEKLAERDVQMEAGHA